MGLLKGTKKLDIIQVTEHYRFYEGATCGFGFSTLNNNLCISINYNEAYLTTAFINNLIEEFLIQFDKLI